MRRLPAGIACSVVLASTIVPQGSARAQVPGDQVSPRNTIELKIKDAVTSTVGPSDVLQVEQSQNDWLWVKTVSGEHGWVLKEDVRVIAREPDPAPSRPAPPAGSAASPAPRDDSKVDDRLYLIGAMGATQVYLTYAYIGAIGDGYVHKTIEAAKVQDLMNEVEGMGSHLIQNLKDVRDGDLTEEDRSALDQMIAINEMLQSQAQALSTYSASPTVDNAQAFDDIRTRVWPLISNLLEIRPTNQGEPLKPKSSATPGTSERAPLPREE